ncbi:MAG: hypothetical protein PHS54_03765 [Clostridia bacterium]|nr:hypothetical protein [Clostridia bacterium]
MNFKNSPFKKCPRCQTKCLVHDKKCNECGLIFERLQYTSNRTAKKNLLNGKRDEVVMIKEWPQDANKVKALWLCGLLGFTGAHNFYLGRFWRASFVLIGLLLTMTFVILSDFGLYGTTIYYIIRYLALIPGACVLIFWVSDFLNILLEKYKIPVSIDENLYEIKSKIIINDEKTVKNKEKIIKFKKKHKKNKN